MDPFSALGAAAAILQFVELSAKILGTAYEIYNSDSGAAQENIRIEDVTNRVKQLSQHVGNSVIHNSSRNTSQISNVTVELAQKAQSLADQLIRSLDSLSIDRSARFQSWQAFRKALRGYFQADHIKTLQTRLDGLRSELMLHLIVMIR